MNKKRTTINFSIEIVKEFNTKQYYKLKYPHGYGGWVCQSMNTLDEVINEVTKYAKRALKDS